jgi:hypothetical protein
MVRPGRCSFLLGVVVASACGDGGGFPDARGPDAPPVGGTFTLAWSLADDGGAPVSCEQVGALTLTVIARNTQIAGGLTEVFSCSTGMGQSQAMLPGTYNLQFELHGASGVLATAPSQHDVVITSGQDTALTPLAFELDATGGLALTLSAGSGGNCGAGGAGIQNMTITLHHSGDQSCAPITFAISAGASHPAGTYTVNCAAPVLAPCIESDQTLSATDVPSGAYTIRVRGKVGGIDCYTNNDGIQVPPLGEVLMRTLNLSHAATTPGC